MADGVLLATLVPISPFFGGAPHELTAGQPYALSRFAYMRAGGGDWLLESPLARARIVLHDWRATAVVHRLARPCRVEEIGAEIPSLSPGAAASVVALLLAAGMAGEPDGGPTCPDAASPALGTWEFHDLLFHARSRAGRHDSPIGGTYRLVGEMDPPPVIELPRAERWIDLERPDLDRIEREDPPFARVQEARRSVREYGDRPLSVGQLGEFLYRVGRLADYFQGEVWTPRGAVSMAYAPRPYPAGGSLYELELYVAVNACDALEAGLYRYDAERHRLGLLPAAAGEVEGLLRDAARGVGMPPENLQVLLVVAARVPRVAWKYASIAYSLVLKHVGVLYQTMYLVATAMGLAPCAVGCGDADRFARAAGIDYYSETSVGEFLLGSRG
jgi:SagB-type dehydrogenase family enzyme